MTKIAIQEQINATKVVTDKALQSTEFAQKILTTVGIIKKEIPAEDKQEKKKK